MKEDYLLNKISISYIYFQRVHSRWCLIPSFSNLQFGIFLLTITFGNVLRNGEIHCTVDIHRLIFVFKTLPQISMDTGVWGGCDDVIVHRWRDIRRMNILHLWLSKWWIFIFWWIMICMFIEVLAVKRAYLKGRCKLAK